MATNSGGWLYETNGTPVDKATADNAQARVLEIKQSSDAASTDAAKALQTANAYAGQIAQANTTAGSAVAIAQGAADDVDEIKGPIDTRLTAVEVAAGYAPGDATDAAMTNIATQENTEFRAALNAQTAEVATTVALGYAGVGSAAVQSFLSVIENGTRDAHLLLIGDSTGNETWEWAYLFFQGLAARYPTHAFHYRLWNDTTQAYDAATTVGSGTRSVTFWNASVAGATTQFWLGDRFGPSIANIPADLVLISLGHNELDTTAGIWRSRYASLTETIAARKPTTPLILIGQNPARDNTRQAQRLEIYKEIAARQGYGFIDAHAAFLSAGEDLTLDGIHPNADGAQLWADVMAGAFIRTKAEPRPQQPSLLARRTVENQMPNGTLADWTGDTPTGWTLGAATSSKVTTGMETGSAAAIFTSTGSGGHAYATLDPGRVKGKTFTMAVRAKVSPAVGDNFPARIGFYDGASSVQPQGSPPAEGYRWLLHTGTFSPTASVARVYLYVGAAGSSMTVDRIVLVEGVWPTDAAEVTATAANGSGVRRTSWSTPSGLAPSAGATAGELRVKREENIVFLRIVNLAIPSGSGQSIVVNVPTGYRSTAGVAPTIGSSYTQLLATGDNNPAFQQYMAIYGGSLYWQGARQAVTGATLDSPSRIDGVLMWYTEDAFPA